MWWGEWHAVSKTMHELSKQKKGQVTLHLKMSNEGRTFCDKSASSLYFHEFKCPDARVFAQWNYYGGYWLPRKDPPNNRVIHVGKDHAKITLCARCAGSLDVKKENLFLQSKQHGTRQQGQVIEEPKFSNMEPPKRPPGTEEMTAHLDEGSVAGPCDEAGIGFKTKYIPWVNCPGCLVRLDEWAEQGLLELDGLYIKA